MYIKLYMYIWLNIVFRLRLYSPLTCLLIVRIAFSIKMPIQCALSKNCCIFSHPG